MQNPLHYIKLKENHLNRQ